MKKSAFSLLELSVSLVVVSLLMAMVSQGIKMVASSRLTTARSLTSKSPVPTIPGLIAWYETTSVDSLKAGEAVDGKQISTWYDISPDSIPARKNTLTRTASSAVVFESDGINKLPSVKFTGSSGIGLVDFYQGSSSQNTIFYAIKPSSISGIIVDTGHTTASGGGVAVFGLASATSMQLFYGTNIIASTSPITLLTNQDYLGATYYNGANSKAFINNATTMITGGALNPGTNLLQGIRIGCDRDNAYCLNGLISEIIVYNRPLQLQERKDVMGYLGKKYGIVVTGL